MIRFETPLNNSLFANKNKFRIPYPNCNDKMTYSASFKCCRCGGYFYWNSAIIVRYGEKDYNINEYCRNCFEKEFPRWKRFLLKISKWYEKRYTKKESYCYSNFSEFHLKTRDGEYLTLMGMNYVHPKTARYPHAKEEW